VEIATEALYVIVADRLASQPIVLSAGERQHAISEIEELPRGQPTKRRAAKIIQEPSQPAPNLLPFTRVADSVH
jgi:hypothetical protein